MRDFISKISGFRAEFALSFFLQLSVMGICSADSGDDFISPASNSMPDHDYMQELIAAVSTELRAPSFLLVATSSGAVKIDPELHFDYSRYSKGQGVIGHSWLLLVEGTRVLFYGGHTGERSHYPPRYLDGLGRLAAWGSLEDSLGESSGMGQPALNPIAYLHHVRFDGAFQQGDGGHSADFAIGIGLTSQQVRRLENVYHSYDFEKYQLFTHQCCHFVQQCLHACRVYVDTSEMQVPACANIGPISITLWQDPSFSRITYLSPCVMTQQLRSKLGQRVHEVTKLYTKYQKSK